jgi:hypothetical protein
MTPCTPIASAYPLHENVDFTAPELDFDGLVGSGLGSKLTACHWVPSASVGALERNGMKPCSYPPIDYDPNPCRRLDSPYEELVDSWCIGSMVCTEPLGELSFHRRFEDGQCCGWGARWDDYPIVGFNPCYVE